MRQSRLATAAAILTTAVLAQQTGNVEIYNGLVYGIGKGTFAIICFVIFSAFLCLIKDCSRSPNVIVGCAIILPIIVFVIIRMLPVKSLESDAENSSKIPTDNFKLKSIFAMVLLILSCLLLCCVMLGSNFSNQLIGRRIDSISVRELKQK